MKDGVIWLFWKALGDGWGLYTKEGEDIRSLSKHDERSFSNRIAVNEEDFKSGRAKPIK